LRTAFVIHYSMFDVECSMFAFFQATARKRPISPGGLFMPRATRWRSVSLCAALAIVVALTVGGSGAGCSDKKPTTRVQLPTRYASLPAKPVPQVFKDTILEKCDLINTEPFLVSGYGLVVNLNNTGSTQAPNLVRQ